MFYIFGMEKEILQKIIDKIVSLPTLPNVVSTLLVAVEDPKTSAKDVNEIISKDQALAAKVLKLVNSAFYGFPRQIDTITRAVTILGFEAIKSLALSATVFDIFKLDAVYKVAFDRELFWKHCLAVGIFNQLIAKKTNISSSEEAFVAGLLHDIGKVVLDQYLHDEFIKILILVKKRNISFIDAENEVIGINHQSIGRWLALKWNLPINLVETITYHHYPRYAKEAREFVSMTHISDYIIKKKRIGNSGDNKVPRLDPEVKKLLKLSDADIEKMSKKLGDEIQKAETFLNLVK